MVSTRRPAPSRNIVGPKGQDDVPTGLGAVAAQGLTEIGLVACQAYLGADIEEARPPTVELIRKRDVVTPAARGRPWPDR
jgi:hypothetical protein